MIIFDTTLKIESQNEYKFASSSMEDIAKIRICYYEETMKDDVDYIILSMESCHVDTILSHESINKLKGIKCYIINERNAICVEGLLEEVYCFYGEFEFKVRVWGKC
jgi:hypothetical protein